MLENLKLYSLNKVVIPIILGLVAVVGLPILFTNVDDVIVSKVEETSSKIEIDASTVNQIFETDISLSSYKYNTICDLGSTPKEIIKKPLPIAFGIILGAYNDNKYVIEFFKTNEFLSMLNSTPEEAFGTTETQGFGAGYDPLFSDAMFWMPVALQIMDVNPDTIEILQPQEGDSNESYSARIISEMNKCQ